MVDSRHNLHFIVSRHLHYLSRKRTHILRVIGQFAAKAMLDSRIIDLMFNKVFLKLVLGEEVPLTVSTLRARAVVYSFVVGADLIAAC